MSRSRCPSRTAQVENPFTAAVRRANVERAFPSATASADDVDAVTVGEDETTHLRIPATGLVAKVHTSVEELAHGYNCHDSLAFFYLVFRFSNCAVFYSAP